MASLLLAAKYPDRKQANEGYSLAYTSFLWRDAVDFFVRLLPAGSSFVAVVLANKQLKSARRATAVTIAKNHYRELLEQFVVNADIVFVGTTADGIEKLKQTPVDYRRYRWLANLALFSLQEVYFAIPEDQNWRASIRVVGTVFKQLDTSKNLAVLSRM